MGGSVRGEARVFHKILHATTAGAPVAPPLRKEQKVNLPPMCHQVRPAE